MALESVHGRHQDLRFDLLPEFGRRDRGRAVGAHAAGVWALVAVESLFVILCGRQGNDGPTRNQGKNANLLTFQALFDHHLPAGGAAEFVAHHDALDGRQCFFGRRTDDGAFSGGQPVGLDDDRVFARLYVGSSRFRMIADAEFRRWHIGVAHELLGERLARFDASRLPRGTKNAQAMLLKFVDDAQRQHVFWANDSQIDRFFACKAYQLVDICRFDRDVDAVGGRARVSGRAVNRFRERRLSQLPYQGVFPPAFANDQNLHARSPSLGSIL